MKAIKRRMLTATLISPVAAGAKERGRILIPSKQDWTGFRGIVEERAREQVCRRIMIVRWVGAGAKERGRTLIPPKQSWIAFCGAAEERACERACRHLGVLRKAADAAERFPRGKGRAVGKISPSIRDLAAFRGIAGRRAGERA
jgi:hypothetical protein